MQKAKVRKEFRKAIVVNKSHQLGQANDSESDTEYKESKAVETEKIQEKTGNIWG